MKRPSLSFLLASILFFCSGALGLGYELIWIRKAALVVGASQIALSTVLTSFFLGMGLGCYVVGRYSRKRKRSPLFIYGLFEIGIGLFALAFPWLFDLLEGCYAAIYPLVESSDTLLFTTRFALLFALCLPPTFLMGGTLPLLLDGLIAEDRSIGSRTSLLYGINILGAVFGVLLTCYLAIPLLGMNASSMLGGIGNMSLGACAMFFFRKTRPLHEEADAGRPARFHTVLGFVTGFLAIAWQIAWARYFTLFELSTIYMTAMLLAVYLLALATGSLVLAPLLERGKNPLRILAFVQAALPLAALYGLEGWRLVVLRPRIEAYRTKDGFVPDATMAMQHNWSFFSETADAVFFAPFLAVAFVIFLPVVLIGIALPALISAATRKSSELRSTAGRIVFWNTLGASAGAFLTGYFLIPALGLHWTLTALGLGSLGVACAIKLKLGQRHGKTFLLPVICFAGIVFFMTQEDISFRTIQNFGYGRDNAMVKWQPELAKDRPKLVVVVEGPLATHWIFDGKDKTLLGSGTVSLATFSKKGIPGQAIQGHIPVLLFPGDGTPQNCLGICLGSGQSFGSLLLYDIKHLDVVDIAKKLVDLSLRRFAEFNHDLGRDERVKFHLDDGRHFVQRSASEFYDIVSMEPPPPRADGIYSLYSIEFYSHVKRVLTKTGVLMQWLPLYRITPQDAKSIIKTQAVIFPHTFVVKQGDEDFMVLSYKTRPVFSLDAIRKRCETFAKERNVAGKRWGYYCKAEIASAEGVLSTIVIGPTDVKKIEAPTIYSDDTQRLSYGTGDRWLLHRYRGHFLARITFAALPETKMEQLSSYFDPPLPKELIERATAERAAALQFYKVPSPADIFNLANRAKNAKSPEARAKAWFSLAQANDRWLDKDKAFDLIGFALNAYPTNKAPEHIELARKIVRNYLAVYRDKSADWLEKLGRAFPKSPILRAMRQELEAFDAKEKERKARYLFPGG